MNPLPLPPGLLQPHSASTIYFLNILNHHVSQKAAAHLQAAHIALTPPSTLSSLTNAEVIATKFRQGLQLVDVGRPEGKFPSSEEEWIQAVPHLVKRKSVLNLSDVILPCFSIAIIKNPEATRPLTMAYAMVSKLRVVTSRQYREVINAANSANDQFAFWAEMTVDAPVVLQPVFSFSSWRQLFSAQAP